jgi:uracil-DNA glycosylase
MSTMAELRGDATPFVPGSGADLADLARAAQSCRGCDLFERATQAVFGIGPAPASLMLVGEQPGDAEDRAGRPFVGPAGRVFYRAMAEAGIEAGESYVTGAVKHFRWREDPGGGKRRLHQRPDSWQVRACWPWLVAEIERVNPRLLVTLGATAGQAIFGRSFRVGAQRGQQVRWQPPGKEGRGHQAEIVVVPTIHPSAVLRADDQDAAYAGFVDDLREVSRALGEAT